MSQIDTLLRNNASYAAGLSDTDLPAPPARRVAIVACMDARLETGALLGLREGDAHVIRNAGGVVTDDVIRSLAVSQAALGTREVMLIHHTLCGMLAPTDADLRRAIRRETGVDPDFDLGTFADVEEDVRRSLERVRTSPYLAHRDEVRGFVYEVETGRLREVT